MLDAKKFERRFESKTCLVSWGNDDCYVPRMKIRLMVIHGMHNRDYKKRKSDTFAEVAILWRRGNRSPLEGDDTTAFVDAHSFGTVELDALNRSMLSKTTAMAIYQLSRLIIWRERILFRTSSPYRGLRFFEMSSMKLDRPFCHCAEVLVVINLQFLGRAS